MGLTRRFGIGACKTGIPETAQVQAREAGAIVDSPYVLAHQHPTSPHVVVAFSSVDTPTGKFGYSRTLRSVDASIVFLNCPDSRWYLDGVPGLGADPVEAAAALRKLVDRLRGPDGRVVVIGSSMGGYGAVVYGALAGVDFVFAASVEFILNIEGGTSIQRLKGRQPVFPAIRILAEAKVPMLILYGERAFPDMVCAHHAAFALSGSPVAIQSLKNLPHSVPLHLHARYGIGKLAGAMTQGQLRLDEVDRGDLIEHCELIRCFDAAERAARLANADRTAPAEIAEQMLDGLAAKSYGPINRSYLLYYTALVSRTLRKTEKALEAVTEAVSLNSQHPGAHLVAVECALQLGRSTMAEASAERAVALVEARPATVERSTFRRLVQALQKLSRPDEAARLLSRAPKRHQADPLEAPE